MSRGLSLRTNHHQSKTISTNHHEDATQRGAGRSDESAADCSSGSHHQDGRSAAFGHAVGKLRKFSSLCLHTRCSTATTFQAQTGTAALLRRHPTVEGFLARVQLYHGEGDDAQRCGKDLPPHNCHVEH